MSNSEYEKALGSWLAEVSVTNGTSDEPGIFLNKFIFTHKNSNQLCLVLFDVNELGAENLGGEYYKAVEETMAQMPPGFPMVNSIMYSEKAAQISQKP